MPLKRSTRHVDLSAVCSPQSPLNGAEKRRIRNRLRNQRCVRPRCHAEISHFFPPTSNAHLNILLPWTQRIEVQSKGRIKFQVYPSMQLGGTPSQLFDQAKDGVADIVWTLPGYTPGRFPKSEVF